MNFSKIKNIVLKSISGIMGITFIIGASSLDSEGTIVPILMVVISTVWLILFAIANGYMDIGGDDDEPYDQLPKRRNR